MKATVYIQNLKCGGCANTISTKLGELKNISAVNVDTEQSAVSFNYSELKDLEIVKTTLKKIGYPEDGDANSLGTKAKSYISCAIGKMNS